MAPRPLFPALLLVSLCAFAIAAPGVAPAAYPGGNGELVFTSTQDGARHIFVKTTTGTKDLTGSTSSAVENQPEFSPDGTKIVFTRLTSGLPNTEIFVMNSNGTNRHALTRTSTGNTDPTWSPDGKRIAFVSQRNGVPGDIYVMSADGTHVHQITHSAAAESDLNWGSTGRIAFVRVPSGGGDRDIYSIRPGGTGLENLTSDPSYDEEQPDYSPSGYQIVYGGTHHPTGSVGGDLWVMNANGTNQHPLLHENNGYSDGAYPAWSPNGNMIAFVANNGTGHPGIWKVPAGGGTNIQVLQSPLDEDVDWQPVAP
jgi:TolB protein